MEQKNTQEKFKEIISKLPEDKKKELYAKLRNMSSEERNKTIEQLVKKDDQLRKQQNKKPNQEVVKKDPKQENKQEKKQPKDVKKKKPKQKLNAKGIKFLVATIAVLLIVSAGIFVVVKYKSKIKDVITPTTTTTVVETSETTVQTIPAPTATPTPIPSPTPTPVPVAEDAPDLTGLIVVLDPGHQEKTSEKVESYSSDSKNTKPGSTPGSKGAVTGIHEYEVTLNQSLIIKEYLEGCGATVVMTRTVNDIDLTNQERAQIATAANCTVFIRIHADGANDSATSGIKIFVPEGGTYTRATLNKADKLGELLSEAEGLEYLGATKTKVYTGLNYAKKIPAMQVSLGFLTNSQDEKVLTSEDVQYKIAVKFAEFLAEYKK